MTQSVKKATAGERKPAKLPVRRFGLGTVSSFSYYALHESERKAASARFRSKAARSAKKNAR